MNKKDASAALQVSIRLVEKYASEGRLGEVKYVRGKTGKQADFDPASVEKLKAELESVDRQLIAPNRRAANLNGALSEQTPPAVMALVEALRSAVDTSPVWLTKGEALKASGIPERWFDRAVRAGLVPHIGEGRGRRFHRSDVRRYAESLRGSAGAASG